MHFTYPDAIGTTGSVLIIIAYLLLQASVVKSNSYLYLSLNLTGATLILVSLYFTPNNASVIIELFWISISTFGIIKKRIKDKKYENPTTRF